MLARAAPGRSFGHCRGHSRHIAAIRQVVPCPEASTSSRARRALVCCAAKKSYYDVLGVPQSATLKDIKSAYRKAALKLHPDVNPAADAKEKFMEAKAAFETLTDAAKKAEYDRRLRMGFDSSGYGSGYGSGGFGGSSNSNHQSKKYRVTQPDEDSYSFDDLLRDLDKEFSTWQSAATKAGAPKGLWEELESVGEELLDFLEEGMGIKDQKDDGKQQQTSSSNGSSSSRGSSSESSKASSRGSSSESSKASSSGSSSSSTSAGSDFYKKYEDKFNQYEETLKDKYAPPEPPPRPKQQQQQQPQQPKASKPPEQEIDDMLAALKKKYNKT